MAKSEKSLTRRDFLGMAAATAAGGGYDLVVVPDHLVARFRERRLLSPLPRDLMKSRDGVERRFRDPAYDPGLAYSIPYLWGATGLGVDVQNVPRRPDSWRALWDERYKGRLSMLDDAREALQCALLVLGLPLDAKSAGAVDKARDLLLRQRPLLKGYDSSTYADDLAKHEVWLAQAWSGDVMLPALQGRPLDFVIPSEGAVIWTDSLCLPKASAHKDEAVALTEYLSRPDVAAQTSQATCYATPNERAMALLKPSLRDDPRIYPDEARLKRLRFAPALDAQTEAAWAPRRRAGTLPGRPAARRRPRS